MKLQKFVLAGVVSLSACLAQNVFASEDKIIFDNEAKAKVYCPSSNELRYYNGKVTATHKAEVSTPLWNFESSANQPKPLEVDANGNITEAKHSNQKHGNFGYRVLHNTYTEIVCYYSYHDRNYHDVDLIMKRVQ